MSGIRANHAGDPDRDAADRLDALWDDLVRTGSADLSTATDGDAARLSLISYAGLLVPRSDPESRERIRRRVFDDYPEDAMRTTANAWTPAMSAGDEPMPLPRPWPAGTTRRPRWRGTIGLRELAITAFLVIATIGGFTLLRPDDEPKSLPAAGSPELGLGSPSASDDTTSSEELLTLNLDGPPSTAYSIVLTRVTMDGGARWELDAYPFADVRAPVDFLVETGTIEVSTGDGDYTFQEDERPDLDETPSYLRNPAQTPVTFMMAIANSSDQPQPEPPSGVTLNPLGSVPIPPIVGAREIDVRLTWSALAPNSGAALPTAPKTSTVFVAVESGTLLARTVPGAPVRSGRFGPEVTEDTELPDFSDAPDDGIEVGPGETLTLDRTFVITDSAVVGDEPVEVLALSYTVEDEPGQAETTAPNEVVWSIPSDGGRVSLQMYKIAIASDGALSQPVDGAAIMRVLEGTVAVTHDAGGAPLQLGPDDFFSVTGPSRFSVEPLGDGPAVLIAGLVFPTGGENQLHALGLESNFVLTPLGVGEVTLPPGNAHIQLWTETLSPDPANSVVALKTNGASLVSIITGSADIVRYGGEVVIFDGPFSREDESAGEGQEYPFGVKVTASSGDAFVAQPRSGYSMSTHGDEAPLVSTLSIGSETPVDMTSPGPRGDEPIVAYATDCQIEPMPAADLRRLVENADNTRIDQGMRDDASTGVEADAATAAEITATVRESLACARFGTPLQGYAFFTENALLAGAIANGLTLEQIDAMEHATPETYPDDLVGTFSIDEISIFPDGRAGAWIFSEGELAYLTFVFDQGTGRWLIDAWDDRERT